MRNVAWAVLLLLLGTTPAWADPPWAEKLFKEGTTKDFANIPRGTQLHHAFKLNNPYAVPLDINARSGCGCVTVAQKNQTLQPKQDGVIDITMDARLFQGPKKVNIHITVSAPNYFSSTTLEVSANSRTDVVLNPGEISLGLAAAGSQLCQLLIIEPGYGIFHLLGIDVRGLQRLLGNWGGDEMPNRFNVPLARLGGRNGRTLQFSQADYMALRQRVLWNRKHNC